MATTTATKLTFTVTHATQWGAIEELKHGKHVWFCSQCEQAGIVELGNRAPGASVHYAHFTSVLMCRGQTF